MYCFLDNIKVMYIDETWINPLKIRNKVYGFVEKNCIGKL